MWTMAASHACKASEVEGQPTDSGVQNAAPKKASELAHGTSAAQAIMAGLIQAGASKKLIIDAVGKIMKSSMTDAKPAGSISLEISEDVKQRLTKVVPSMIIQDEHQTGHLRDIVAAPHWAGERHQTNSHRIQRGNSLGTAQLPQGRFLQATSVTCGARQG